MSVSTGELGTGKYDEHQLQVLREMEQELINNPDNLDPEEHRALLDKIRIALHGSELSLMQKLNQIYVNNFAFLGSIREIGGKIFGQNIWPEYLTRISGQNIRSGYLVRISGQDIWSGYRTRISDQDI